MGKTFILWLVFMILLKCYKELLVTLKQYEYIIFFRVEVTFWWIMPFGDELLVSDICDLCSVKWFLVTDLWEFVAIFKKAFVFKLYNKLRHLRSTRDGNLICMLCNFIHYNASECQQWWHIPVIWSYRWPVGCWDLPNAFTWRSWEWLSCFLLPASPWDLCWSSKGGGEPACLSSTFLLLAT